MKRELKLPIYYQCFGGLLYLLAIQSVFAAEEKKRSLTAAVEETLGTAGCFEFREASGVEFFQLGELGLELANFCLGNDTSSAATTGGSLDTSQSTMSVSQSNVVSDRVDRRRSKKNRNRRNVNFHEQSKYYSLATAARFGVADDDTIHAFGDDFGAFGLSFAFGYADIKKTASNLEDGYVSDLFDGAFALDFEASRNVVVGFLVSGARQEGTYQGAFLGGNLDNPNVDGLTSGSDIYQRCLEEADVELPNGFSAGGEFKTNSKSVGGYVFLLPEDRNHYLTVTAAYQEGRYDYSRNICSFQTGTGVLALANVFGGMISGDVETEALTLDINAGTMFKAGPLYLKPSLGVQWNRAKSNRYTEQGVTIFDQTSFFPVGSGFLITPIFAGVNPTGLELDFDKQIEVSFVSTISVSASYLLQLNQNKTLEPFVAAAFQHQFEDDSRPVTVRFAQDLTSDPLSFTFDTEEPDRNYGFINFGIVANWGPNWVGFLSGSRSVANSQFRVHGLQVGVRRSF